MIRRSVFLLCLLSLLALLTACSDSGHNPTSGAVVPTAHNQQDGQRNTAIGNIIEYPLPQTRSGLMRPVVDHEGRVWVAEMGNNTLAVFDPHTQTFRQTMPPRSKGGLMGVLIAPDNTVWYSEQFANYIGHYDPAHDRYQEFNLPTVKISDPGDTHNTLTLPSAPNDLAMDAHGNLWFTEMNTDSIGKLDVTTGQFFHYPLAHPATVQKYNPYGITIDPQENIWFTEASTNVLGRLDPTTSTFHFFTLPGPSNPLMEVVSDRSGAIWATTFNRATLLKFDPHRGEFSTYLAPAASSGISGMYGLTITPQNEVWVTIPGANVIARFDVAAKRFTYYQIPTENSSPLGIAYGQDHTIWFTESAGNQLGQLKI